VRRNTFSKDDETTFDETTTSNSDYRSHQTVGRVEITRQKDNLTVGEGRFDVNNFSKTSANVKN